MRGEVHILVYCPIDTLQWGSTHSALGLTRAFNCLCAFVQVGAEGCTVETKWLHWTPAWCSEVQ